MFANLTALVLKIMIATIVYQSRFIKPIDISIPITNTDANPIALVY
jgi:hypothetical protein